MMKLQYARDLLELQEAWKAGVSLGVVKYTVPSMPRHFSGLGWRVGETIPQHRKYGEHTVVCIPNSDLDSGCKLLEVENSSWVPLEPEFLFWDEQELGPRHESFGFYCLEVPLKLFEGVKTIAEILQPELVVVGRSAGQRCEYQARNFYHWIQLFQIQQAPF